MSSIGSNEMPVAAAQSDFRRQALDEWVAEMLGVALVRGTAASSDASFRRYFRYPQGAGSVVAMDAPPPQEDCRPFVRVAELLLQAGVHVPTVLFQDLGRGFLLLSDLGTQTYLDVLTDDSADTLFHGAMDALLKWQCASREGVLPPYDEALLRRELELFPEWYLGRHLGLTAREIPREALDQLFDLLVERALGQACVYVHRDFMPRNLMVTDPNPGVIDFQDAVYGPISYDPVSLFKDAFISWPEARVEGYLRHYWAQAKACGLPVPEQFATFQVDCDWMGAQRHLKVMGIFARICYRDGKPNYLQDVDRFAEYLRGVAHRYPELEPLREVLSIVPQARRGGAGL